MKNKAKATSYKPKKPKKKSNKVAGGFDSNITKRRKVA